MFLSLSMHPPFPLNQECRVCVRRKETIFKDLRLPTSFPLLGPLIENHLDHLDQCSAARESSSSKAMKRPNSKSLNAHARFQCFQLYLTTLKTETVTAGRLKLLLFRLLFSLHGFLEAFVWWRSPSLTLMPYDALMGNLQCHKPSNFWSIVYTSDEFHPSCWAFGIVGSPLFIGDLTSGILYALQLQGSCEFPTCISLRRKLPNIIKHLISSFKDISGPVVCSEACYSIVQSQVT